MIGDVQMKVGGTALTARLESTGILSEGIGMLQRSLSRIVSFPKTGSPAFAVDESIENFTVEFEAPGYDESDLVLDVTSHSVTLRCPDELARNRGLTPFERSVPMPEPVATDQVVATHQNGVVKVELPKLAWVKGHARRVPLDASPSGSKSEPPRRQRDERQDPVK